MSIEWPKKGTGTEARPMTFVEFVSALWPPGTRSATTRENAHIGLYAWAEFINLHFTKGGTRTTEDYIAALLEGMLFAALMTSGALRNVTRAIPARYNDEGREIARAIPAGVVNVHGLRLDQLTGVAQPSQATGAASQSRASGEEDLEAAMRDAFGQPGSSAQHASGRAAPPPSLVESVALSERRLPTAQGARTYVPFSGGADSVSGSSTAVDPPPSPAELEPLRPDVERYMTDLANYIDQAIDRYKADVQPAQ